jgi:hypothetical protein
MVIKIFNKIVILAALLLTVTSCGFSDKETLTEICKKNAELCNDLHKANFCHYKRAHLIRARYNDKVQPNKEHTLNLLDELSDYESCLELTLLMEFTKRREQKHKLAENYFTTQRLMKEKLNDIKNTQNPHIAYYLWTHYQDIGAKKVFLNAANKEETKDVKLLLKLANSYAKEYPQQSLNLFYKALKESHSLKEIPDRTFTFIMTIFYQQKNFEQAYIWALVAQEVNTEKEYPINLKLILQKGIRNGQQQIFNENALEDKADAYYEQLKEGVFNQQAPQLNNQ